MKQYSLYKGKVLINFEEKPWHKYTRVENNERIKSVTKIIKVLDKPALKYWAANVGAEFVLRNWDLKKKYNPAEQMKILEGAAKEHNNIKKAKGLSGNLVHDFAESFVKGLKPPMPKDEKVRNGASAFMKWFSETDIVPIETERVVYSKKLNIIGKADLDAKIKGKRHVIDYKTSSLYKRAKFYELDEYPDGFARDEQGDLIKTPIYKEVILQVSAYRGFLMEELGIKYEDSIIVRIDKDFGDCDVTILPAEIQDEAYEVFKGLIPVESWFNNKKIKI